MQRAGQPTLLELLLPAGQAERAAVLGSACPPRLLPASRPDDGSGGLDLVIIAPTAAEERRRGWLRAAVGVCSARLTADGLVYVLVRPSARPLARRLLRAGGIPVQAAVLHVAGVAESQQLAPLAANEAFGTIVPLAPCKRVILRTLLGLGGGATLAATHDAVGLLSRRPRGRPLFDWLRIAEGAPAPYRGVVVSASWRPDGPMVVLHPLAASPAAAIVAKAALYDTATAASEDAMLRRLAPSARRAGVAVPRPVGSAQAGSATFLLESRVEGQIVAQMLARRPAELEGILGALVRWLGEWQRLTATVTPLGREILEREVLAPVAQLAAQIGDGERYIAALTRRCAAIEGTEVSLTAAHNDLTMWNVLRDRRGGLAVVDWEVAEEHALPLKDFFYAAVDAVSATDRYADRPGAYDACLRPAGSAGALTARLQASIAATLPVAPEVVELSRHACWLGHAVNESRATGSAGARPFLEIVRRLAATTAL